MATGVSSRSADPRTVSTGTVTGAADGVQEITLQTQDDYVFTPSRFTVAPGKGGLGTFAPRLDGAGNSVRGQLLTRFLSHHLGLNIFSSTAAVPDPGVSARRTTD